MENAISRRTMLKLAAVGATEIAFPSIFPEEAHATTWSAFSSATWDSPVGNITTSARNGIAKAGLTGTAYTQATTSKTVPAGNLNAVAKLTDGAGLIIGSTRIAKKRLRQQGSHGKYFWKFGNGLPVSWMGLQLVVIERAIRLPVLAFGAFVSSLRRQRQRSNVRKYSRRPVLGRLARPCCRVYR